MSETMNPVAYIQHSHSPEDGHEEELVWRKDEDLEGGLYDYESLFTADQLAQARREAWPDRPTPAMRDALRTGSRRDCPSDELCDVRYAALLAALRALPVEGE